jgi:hypothetical protein
MHVCLYVRLHTIYCKYFVKRQENSCEQRSHWHVQCIYVCCMCVEYMYVCIIISHCKYSLIMQFILSCTGPPVTDALYVCVSLYVYRCIYIVGQVFCESSRLKVFYDA